MLLLEARDRHHKALGYHIGRKDRGMMDWQVFEMMWGVVLIPGAPQHATLMLMTPRTTQVYLLREHDRLVLHCRERDDDPCAFNDC